MCKEAYNIKGLPKSCKQKFTTRLCFQQLTFQRKRPANDKTGSAIDPLERAVLLEDFLE